MRDWTIIFSWVEVSFTLGDRLSSESFDMRYGPVLLDSKYVVLLIVCTLETGVSLEIEFVTGSGSLLTHCNWVANSSKAFLTGSPSWSDGVVDEGGWVRRVMISSADWTR